MKIVKNMLREEIEINSAHFTMFLCSFVVLFLFIFDLLVTHKKIFGFFSHCPLCCATNHSIANTSTISVMQRTKQSYLLFFKAFYCHCGG